VKKWVDLILEQKIRLLIMCGISGFIDFNKKITREQLMAACNSIQHRGPDNGDIVVFETPEATIGLGHRRLAILDLSPLGRQPMYSDDKSITILLNGEIYNFKEIRSDLVEKGYHFSSNSDTEVVLKAYQQYGTDCLHKFIGMFAIVIYDSNLQKVFLIRDRTGVKPLYYYFADGCLLFASELKAFHRFPNFKKEIDDEAVSLFFKYGYIKAPYTIFKNTHKLLPGYIATLNLKDQSLKLAQYWNVLDFYKKPIIAIDEKEAIDELETLCKSAFQYRMVSDVPVGVFLSGGYDSSLLAAILQKNNIKKINTFTIGFKDEEFNEANHAKNVAKHLGTNHNEYYCTTKEAEEIIPLLPFFYDEPFGDSSAIPTILVSRFAREQVTVALSADGGDEIFAGYERYDQLTTINKLQKKLPYFVRKGGAKLLLSLPGINMRRRKIAALLTEDNILVTSDLVSEHFLRDDLHRLIKNKSLHNQTLNEFGSIPQGLAMINSLLIADYKTYLSDDILTKVDRATMSIGLEGREPFLDHRIIEWAAQLPVDLKYKNGNKKYVLKQLTHKYVPFDIMNRPKMGFGIPFGKWLKGNLKPLFLETVSEENLLKQNVLNKDYVLKLTNDYFDGKATNDWQIWLIFMFMLWWEEWM
jgi:asparagine synthase (glutamine-hydrolysing)